MCACTVTSSAVVGSSAMMQSRRTADRHGDHRALPLAARELERIGSRGAFRLGQSHALEQLDRAPRASRLPQPAMQPQRLGDLRADACAAD